MITLEEAKKKVLNSNRSLEIIKTEDLGDKFLIISQPIDYNSKTDGIYIGGAFTIRKRDGFMKIYNPMLGD